MFKKTFIAACIGAVSTVCLSGAANAAYIDPATNQIVSEGGEVTLTFNLANAGDYSNLFSLKTGEKLFTNKTTALGSVFDLGTYSAGETIAFRIDNFFKKVSFFTGLAADNYDNFLHAILTPNADGSITVAFEDLPNGGDKDFDDFVFTISEKVMPVIETPIPAAGALMMSALAGFGFATRRRKAVEA